MIVIGQARFSGRHSVTIQPRDPQIDVVLKIVGGGHLTANGADRRLLLRLNGQSGPYKNFVELRGDAAHNENESDGFYIGRNGYGEDATFSFEYTLSIVSRMNRITGFGLATYAQAAPLNRFYTFQGHGVLDKMFAVTSLELTASSAGIEGSVVVYAARL